MEKHYFDYGIELLNNKHYTEAISYFLDVYQVLVTNLGKVHEYTNECLFYIAKGYFLDGQYNQAKKYGMECIRRGELLHKIMIDHITLMYDVYHALGEDSEAISLSIKYVKLYSSPESNFTGPVFSYGLDLLDHRYYSEASRYFEDIYRVLKENLGKYSPATIDSLYYIAHCLFMNHEEEKACKYCEECCRRNASIKRTHLDSLELMFKIYMYLSNYQHALELAQLYFTNVKKVFDSNHINYFNSLHNLALCYYYNGNLNESIKQFYECQKISEKNEFIPLDVTMIMKANLAVCLGDQGQYDQALEILDDAYSYFRSKQVSGELIYNILDNLSDAYLKLGYSSKAIDLLSKSYSYRIQAGKENELDTLVCMNNLASAYEMKNKDDKAMDLIISCIQKREKYDPKNEIDLLVLKNNLAVLLEKKHEYKKSLKLFQECYDRRCQILNKENPDTLLSLYNLAKSYYHNHDLDRAHSLANECLERRKHVFGDLHSTIAETIALLSDISEGVNSEQQFTYLKDYLDSYVFFVTNTNHQELIEYFQSFNYYYGKYRKILFKRKSITDHEKDLLIRNKNIIFDVELVQNNKDIKIELNETMELDQANSLKKSRKKGKINKDTASRDSFMQMIHNTTVSNIQKVLAEDELVLDLYELDPSHYGIVYLTSDECHLFVQENIIQYLSTYVNETQQHKIYCAVDGNLANQSLERYLTSKEVVYLSSLKSLMIKNGSDSLNTSELFVNASYNDSGMASTRGTLGNLISSTIEKDNLSKLIKDVNIHSENHFTKEELMKIVQPKILHISTHGQYDHTCEDQMEKSRILLSGYNSELKSKDTYLTAKEASHLNLKGTRMVFLSTCVSGLGQIVDGIGMYGFRRSLELAGCGYIITTIEIVDDINATIFSNVFYSRLQSGMSVEEAFFSTKEYLQQEAALQEIENFICSATQYGIEYKYLELRWNRSKEEKHIMKGKYSRNIEDWNGFILQKA